jgi:hypothetical protein
MKTFLFSLLCIGSFSAYSQDNIFTLHKTFEQGLTSMHCSVFACINKDSNELHLSLVDNKTVDRYIIDSNWKIKKEFSVKLNSDDNIPKRRFDQMQILFSGGKEYNIYKDGSDLFYVDEVDYDAQKESHISSLPIASDQSFIADLVSGDVYCQILADKKGNLLKLVSNAKNGGAIFETIPVELNIYTTDKSAAKIMTDAAVIGPGIPGLDALATHNKIYYSGNKVYISNENDSATFITEVDLKTGAIQRKIFPQYTFEQVPKEDATKSSASFLYKNTLVNGNADNDALTLCFYSYDDGKLLKAYHAGEDDTIHFKNTSIIDCSAEVAPVGPVAHPIGRAAMGTPQIIPPYVPDTSHDVKHTGKFIRHALNHGFVLALSDRGNDELQLRVENYSLVRQGGNMPGMSFMVPGGIGGLATVMTMGGSGVFGNAMIKEEDTYFNGYFNDSTYGHIKNDMEVKKTNDSIIRKELNGTDKLVFTFQWNNSMYMGFYKEAYDKGVYTIERLPVPMY